MDPEREEIDESGRNPTQQRIDEEAAEERPVDVDWQDEASPHQGEQGTDPAV